MRRSSLTGPQLAEVARAAAGPGRRLTATARLRGGSKKGVYRLTFADGTTAILYVWHPAENYWPSTVDSSADPFTDSSCIELFVASQQLLETLGVRTPRVFFLDDSRARYPADLAVVEDVPGPTLEALLHHDPGRAEQPLARLGSMLATMHGHRGNRFGKLAVVTGGTTPESRSAEQVVLDRALAHLDEAAARVERIAAVRDRLADLTGELAAAIAPRQEYGLIHGELGPDHVLVDGAGQPVLVDIEGTMFFDAEWEHAFLAFRFGAAYRWLRSADLDERRLRFYALALHLSLIAGPLRLLDGDFPEREPMLRIVEYNVDRTLGFLPDGRTEVSR